MRRLAAPPCARRRRPDFLPSNLVLGSAFLLVLVVGLVMGVFAMLYGTERAARPGAAVAPHERRSAHDPAAEPSPLFNLSTVAALVFATGLTGSITARVTTWPMGTQLVVALLAGGAASAAQALLVARWAIPGARADQPDERYLMQGIVGTVTRAVPIDGVGELSYELDGGRHTLPARGIEPTPLPAGTEVVIDRVEDGVAWVEAWARVEQRL